jgi:hypothetical protein
VKPLVKSTGLQGSIGKCFNRRLIWYRRFWNSYYMFEYEWEDNAVFVYKNMYNPQHWQDEWTQVHHFKLK